MAGCFGVVAEFNPFHNGHAALCKAARERGAQEIIAVMSGNFVQRGEIAVSDKHVRAQAALCSGVDLVLELPLPWAMAPARRFALGAVSILKETGCVDALCFGSECGDMALLREVAEALESDRVQAEITQRLAGGMTYAKARQLAVEAVFGAAAGLCLSTPNNTLAVEYLRQAISLGWDVDAVTVKRVGSGHDSGNPVGTMASASYLRGLNEVGQWASFVPGEAMEAYREAASKGLLPAKQERLEIAVLSQLRRMTPEESAILPDLSEGLENRLLKAVRSATTLDELLEAVKTKRYTMARIRRLVSSAFLGIQTRHIVGTPPYIRVLGCNDRGTALLSRMKGCTLPVHTSLAKLEGMGGRCGEIANLEAVAGDQYGLALPRALPCGWEYTASAVFMKK